MIQIRKMSETDTAGVAEIEASCFSRPWSKESFQNAVKSENAIYLVAEAGEKIVGYAGMWVAADEGEITNVAVDKAYRNQKLGRRIMEEMWKYGASSGVSSYFLEVRKSNQSAIALYQGQGFEAIGVRRNFYEAPPEDGIIMNKR